MWAGGRSVGDISLPCTEKPVYYRVKLALLGMHSLFRTCEYVFKGFEYIFKGCVYIFKAFE